MMLPQQSPPCIRKIVIKLDQNASLSVVEKTDLKGDQSVFQTISENILVGENAIFNYYKIQNDPGQLIQVANTTITSKKIEPNQHLHHYAGWQVHPKQSQHQY